MSVSELAKVIGSVGSLRVEVGSGNSWGVLAEVLDARVVWGKTQYQVTPVGSNGSPVWVESYRFTVG